MLLSLIWLTIWLASYALLDRIWDFADRWLLLSGLTLALILWRLRHNLPLNRSPDGGSIEATFGPGNAISVGRALAIGLLAGFLFAPWPDGGLAWGIAVLYTAACIADSFDGYAARRSGRVTDLGQWLDIELDSVGTLIVVLLGIGYGQLPLWFLSVGLARYLFVAGLWWRDQQKLPVYDLPPSAQRRILAGLMMAFLTVILWPIVPAPMAQLAATALAVPFLLGFLRDWLFASGRLQGNEPVYRHAKSFMTNLFASWLPLLWRIALPLAMAAIIRSGSPLVQPASWVDLLASWGLPATGALASTAVLVALAGTLLATLGIAGRLAIIPLLFPIGFDITLQRLTWANGVALLAALGIGVFGSGPLSLWQPEEAFMNARSQAPRTRASANS